MREKYPTPDDQILSPPTERGAGQIKQKGMESKKAGSQITLVRGIIWCAQQVLQQH